MAITPSLVEKNVFIKYGFLMKTGDVLHHSSDCDWDGYHELLAEHLAATQRGKKCHLAPVRALLGPNQ
jgi:hypothetical protein